MYPGAGCRSGKLKPNAAWFPDSCQVQRLLARMPTPAIGVETSRRTPLRDGESCVSKPKVAFLKGVAVGAAYLNAYAHVRRWPPACSIGTSVWFFNKTAGRGRSPRTRGYAPPFAQTQLVQASLVMGLHSRCFPLTKGDENHALAWLSNE